MLIAHSLSFFIFFGHYLNVEDCGVLPGGNSRAVNLMRFIINHIIYKNAIKMFMQLNRMIKQIL